MGCLVPLLVVVAAIISAAAAAQVHLGEAGRRGSLLVNPVEHLGGINVIVAGAAASGTGVLVATGVVKRVGLPALQLEVAGRA